MALLSDNVQWLIAAASALFGLGAVYYAYKQDRKHKSDTEERRLKEMMEGVVLRNMLPIKDLEQQARLAVRDAQDSASTAQGMTQGALQSMEQLGTLQERTTHLYERVEAEFTSQQATIQGVVYEVTQLREEVRNARETAVSDAGVATEARERIVAIELEERVWRALDKLGNEIQQVERADETPEGRDPRWDFAVTLAPPSPKIYIAVATLSNRTLQGADQRLMATMLDIRGLIAAEHAEGLVIIDRAVNRGGTRVQRRPTLEGDDENGPVRVVMIEAFELAAYQYTESIVRRYRAQNTVAE